MQQLRHESPKRLPSPEKRDSPERRDSSKAPNPKSVFFSPSIDTMTDRPFCEQRAPEYCEPKSMLLNSECLKIFEVIESEIKEEGKKLTALFDNIQLISADVIKAKKILDIMQSKSENKKTKMVLNELADQIESLKINLKRAISKYREAKSILTKWNQEIPAIKSDKSGEIASQTYESWIELSTQLHKQRIDLDCQLGSDSLFSYDDSVALALMNLQKKLQGKHLAFESPDLPSYNCNSELKKLYMDAKYACELENVEDEYHQVVETDLEGYVAYETVSNLEKFVNAIESEEVLCVKKPDAAVRCITDNMQLRISINFLTEIFDNTEIITIINTIQQIANKKIREAEKLIPLIEKYIHENVSAKKIRDFEFNPQEFIQLIMNFAHHRGVYNPMSSTIFYSTILDQLINEIGEGKGNKNKKNILNIDDLSRKTEEQERENQSFLDKIRNKTFNFKEMYFPEDFFDQDIPTLFKNFRPVILKYINEIDSNPENMKMITNILSLLAENAFFMQKEENIIRSLLSGYKGSEKVAAKFHEIFFAQFEQDSKVRYTDAFNEKLGRFYTPEAIGNTIKFLCLNNGFGAENFNILGKKMCAHFIAKHYNINASQFRLHKLEIMRQ